MLTKVEIFEFIAARKIAILGSVDEEGFPNSKAMLAPRKRDGNDFYLTTNTSSLRVQQFRKDPKASLYVYDQQRFEAVMLLGTVEILEDPVSKESIWQPGDTMYYPGGVTDPDYCVLKFTAIKGRHYARFVTENFDF